MTDLLVLALCAGGIFLGGALIGYALASQGYVFDESDEAGA